MEINKFQNNIPLKENTEKLDLFYGFINQNSSTTNESVIAQFTIGDFFGNSDKGFFNQILNEQSLEDSQPEKDNSFILLMGARPDYDLKVPDDDFVKVFKQKLPEKEKKDVPPLPLLSQDVIPIQQKPIIPLTSKVIENTTSSKETTITPSFLGKKVLFTSEKSAHTYHREMKLIQNRMSAKKCRQKKKNYIENIEKDLMNYKNLVMHYQNILIKNQSIEDTFKLLQKKEDEVLSENIFTDEKIEEIKKEYKTAQVWLQNELFIKLLQTIIPLEYKMFYKKFLKLENIENGDDIESAEKKVHKNIKILKELYNFNSNTIENIKLNPMNESIPYKLYYSLLNIANLITNFKGMKE